MSSLRKAEGDEAIQVNDMDCGFFQALQCLKVNVGLLLVWIAALPLVARDDV